MRLNELAGMLGCSDEDYDSVICAEVFMQTIEL
jgi:hypothetical protein